MNLCLKGVDAVHGDAKYLVRFLGGADKRFMIPVYQMNYAWKIPQCKKLYDDLIKVIKMNRENHFLGSIVSVYNPDSYAQEYLIIDGQQRLTTISLLLLALYHLIKQGVVYTDMETAVKEYPDIVQKHFMKCVLIYDHKFVALHGAVWSGGSFVYVPKGVKVDVPNII